MDNRFYRVGARPYKRVIFRTVRNIQLAGIDSHESTRAEIAASKKKKREFEQFRSLLQKSDAIALEATRTAHYEGTSVYEMTAATSKNYRVYFLDEKADYTKLEEYGIPRMLPIMIRIYEPKHMKILLEGDVDRFITVLKEFVHSMRQMAPYLFGSIEPDDFIDRFFKIENFRRFISAKTGGLAMEGVEPTIAYLGTVRDHAVYAPRLANISERHTQVTGVLGNMHIEYLAALLEGYSERPKIEEFLALLNRNNRRAVEALFEFSKTLGN